MNPSKRLYYWSMLTRQVSSVLRAHASVTDAGMELGSLDALLAAAEQLVEGCSRTYDSALEAASPGAGGTGGAAEPPQAGAQSTRRVRRVAAADLTAGLDCDTPPEHETTTPQEDLDPPEDWASDYDASIDALVGP